MYCAVSPHFTCIVLCLHTSHVLCCVSTLHMYCAVSPHFTCIVLCLHTSHVLCCVSTLHMYCAVSPHSTCIVLCLHTLHVLCCVSTLLMYLLLQQVREVCYCCQQIWLVCSLKCTLFCTVSLLTVYRYFITSITGTPLSPPPLSLYCVSNWTVWLHKFSYFIFRMVWNRDIVLLRQQ
jgi:hypothetical protein